jgi:hypothetical protein
MKRTYSSLPFVEGRMYVAIRNQRDRNFQFGESYKCVRIQDKDRFMPNLQKDHSSLKFLNPEGIEMGYFGSVAIDYFSDDIEVIKDAFDWQFKFHKQEIERSRGEMHEKIKVAINHINNIQNSGEELNRIIKAAKAVGISIPTQELEINTFEIYAQLNALNSITKNINSAVKVKKTNFERYMKTDNFKKLVNSHNLDTYSIWEVYGEPKTLDDGNVQPTSLGLFEGRLDKVIKHVVEIESFWKLGIGGTLVERKEAIKRI